LERDLDRLAALLDETKLAVVVEGSHFDVRQRPSLPSAVIMCGLPAR